MKLLINLLLITGIPLFILVTTLVYDRIKIKSYKLQIVPILLFSILSFVFIYSHTKSASSPALIFKNSYIEYVLIALALLTYIYLQIKTFRYKNKIFKTLSIFTIIISLGLASLFSASHYFTYKEIRKLKTYDDNFVCYGKSNIISDSITLYKPIPFSNFPLFLVKENSAQTRHIGDNVSLKQKSNIELCDDAHKNYNKA